MILIRKGFDGLDISYPLTISEEIAEKMLQARTAAEASSDKLGLFWHNDVMMAVADRGAKGGYAYFCDSGFGGPHGENWFFKHPRGNADVWGIRVSCRALPLALEGLSKTRARIEDTLAQLGLTYVPGTESIGRVDVACDFLDPDLAPDRAHFVAHSRSTIAEVSDAPVAVVGRSGRVETITVGKNPQREVTLYDKRAQVIAKGKSFWWPIWDDALAAQSLPPLDPSVRASSSVWRVEIRAFKRHLKDRWSVTTWGDLREKLPAILQQALDDVRFTVPNDDTNRARWPVHPLWTLAGEALEADMENLHSMADRAKIDALLKAERDDMLRKQIAGCMLSRAALNDVPDERLGVYAMGCADQITRDWEREAERTRERLAQARAKYGGMAE